VARLLLCCDGAGQPRTARGSRAVVLQAHSQIIALWSERLARELQQPLHAADGADGGGLCC
jgi:hypothetical protein